MARYHNKIVLTLQIKKKLVVDSNLGHLREFINKINNYPHLFILIINYNNKTKKE